jgi:hypothetical protein
MAIAADVVVVVIVSSVISLFAMELSTRLRILIRRGAQYWGNIME